MPEGGHGPLPHCPPGLEYLTLIDQVAIQQHPAMIEGFTAFERHNKYIAMNARAQPVYLMAEVVDYKGDEVMRLLRPMRCQFCCFMSCLQRIEVEAPPGTRIGFVAQDWTVCTPCFSIYDSTGRAVLGVVGPFCPAGVMGRNFTFQVLTLGGLEIGIICKRWEGFVKESFTDPEIFGVSFPLDLDVHLKAVLIACAMLIDFVYFETGKVPKPIR
ncbi:phospholipid scramblase 1-like isoform X2 [Ornithodoros turicata]|uniref:phospholipid scramblase 1-like isoform X2 n=1 Tax=Ornithodoros turicata TaxID=34597 RepID=UPI003139453F